MPAVDERRLKYREFLHRETNTRHHYYDEEMLQYELLKAGDPRAVEEGQKMMHSGLTGHMVDDPVRNTLYLFIASTTLATRFAIEGGMDEETAYNISDLYIHRVDTVKSTEEILDIHKEMFAYFTERMARIRKEKVCSKQVVLAIRKKDYSDIQQYLIFKCEEGTHRPLRDETGHMIQRDFFIQSGMNCNAFTFDAECVKLNHQFHKNNHKGDIMAHHFIISFDPRDAADHGLTPHKAHALAKEFAEYSFAGHQALIVTHADGNNHAGNIHTHIVINSLRKEKVEWRSFMENPRDCLAGYKHHLTETLLHRMHERLGEICEREHLYTVEIDQPTDKKVTDREYQAQKRGQKEVDSPAADTIKQKIRDAVDDAASRAGTELEFFNILRRDYSIRVNLKRGRYSYVHPDSEKHFTARSLGKAYAREVILEKLRTNRQPVIDNRLEFANLPRVFLVRSDLRLIVDLQSCVKAQQSRAYAQKVTISNIQKMADTVSWLEKNKMNSLNQLTAAKRNLEDRYYDAENDLRHVKNELVEVNQKIKHVGRYLSNKKVYARYQAAEDKDAFRAEYRSQIEAYEESIKALDELFMDDDLPSLKELKERKAELVEKRDRLQAEYKSLAAEMRNMKVVWKNVCYILGRQAELEKEEQREHARPAPEQPPRKRRREMSL